MDDIDIEHQFELAINQQMENQDPGPDPAAARPWHSRRVFQVLKPVGILFSPLLFIAGFAIVLALGASAFALVLALCASILGLGLAFVSPFLALGVALSSPLVAIGVATLCAIPVVVPLIFIIAFSFPEGRFRRFLGVDNDDDVKSNCAEGIGSMYNRSRRQEMVWKRILRSSFGMLARVSLVMLVWLVISLTVPRLRGATILGSPVWKWSLLGVVLTAGYFEAFTLVMLLIILPVLFWKSETREYYLTDSVPSLNHVAYFGLVLGSWLAYFSTEYGLNHASSQAFAYLTWTFVSLFVGSILWLFKVLMLARWSVDTIYRRFEPRIFMTSLKFFFIGLCAAGFFEGRIIKDFGEEFDRVKDDQSTANRFSIATTHTMSKKMGLCQLTYASRILMSLAQIMSPILDREGEEDEVVTWFKQQLKDTTTQPWCTPDDLQKLFYNYEPTKLPSSRKGDEPVELPSSRKGDEPVELPSSRKGDEPVELPSSRKGDEPVELPSSRKGDEPVELPSSPKGDQEEDEPTKLPSSPKEAELAEFPSSSKGDKEGDDQKKSPSSPKEIEPSEFPSSLQGDEEGDEPTKSPYNSEEARGNASARLNKLLLSLFKVYKGVFINMFVVNQQPWELSNQDSKNQKKMANVLFGLVLEECSCAQFTFQDLKIWMVDAHKDCINMGRILVDANGMVTRLDVFISCIIFVIVVLLWLLITGLASNKVLVTVATPFLALTFVFGDTAKTFFQGLVFCFGTHPFDIGDRCILDETELEVKRVSILTTTFIKIGSKEKRLYPNSVLATKAIVNLGWQPDPRDTVEFTLGSSTNINSLEKKLEEFFTKERLLYKDSWELIIKEVGDSPKVAIQFTHVLTVHDLSHNQCYKKKSKQRTYFLKEINEYINESRTK